MNVQTSLCLFATVLAAALVRDAGAQPADLILHNGRIVTVDQAFAVHEAVAMRDGRIARVGRDADALSLRGEHTKVIDLRGRTVLPGLIDSHMHPGMASVTEFDHPLPDFRAVSDVLAYVRSRAETLDDGEWIVIKQVFITRLEERRYPTRAEMDAAAPRNPVIFSTGPDASLNTVALNQFAISRDTKTPAGSKIEKTDAGEPTGILRNWRAFIQIPAVGRAPTERDRDELLLELLQDYTSAGLTTIADRAAGYPDIDPQIIDRYKRLHEQGKLPLRVAISHYVTAKGDSDEIVKQIEKAAAHPLRTGDDMLRIVGIKAILDGGMLTGSAYMRSPWGVSEIYSIDDPNYRGFRYIEQDKLETLVRASAERGMQFTAHCVGDGAVHALIDAYERVGRDTPLNGTRPCISHCNFMSREAVVKMAALGIVADIQPAWLWLDTATLHLQFGDERMRWFQPLRSLFAHGVVVGGGSDHMQKIGAKRSINPYDPWLGMWVTITRRGRGFKGRLHPEESLSRQQAIRFYTINNAHLLFLEDRVGSIEPGKLADLIVIDRDILTCPVDDIRQIHVLRTYVAGRLVHSDGEQ